MKKTALVLLFFVMLMSCNKDKNKFPENPDWLNARISQMETQPGYAGTVVYAYKWNSEYYYYIQVPISSCIYCEFYTYAGVKYEWTDVTFTDFMNYGERLKVVWQRDFSF